MNSVDTVTIKPNYSIWLWNNGRGEMLFSVIEDKTIGEAKKFYEYHELIIGNAANVWVFFNDYDIHRNDCLDAATRFMRGDYVRIDVKNLKADKYGNYEAEIIKTKGSDKTHPRQ